MLLRTVVRMLSAGLIVVGAGSVCGQNYPNKPIRILTAGVGGASDTVARMVGQGLVENLGQQVVVDNRPTIISGVIAAKSLPDGYNILCTGIAHWLAPLLQPGVGYDPIKDFSAVTLAVTSPNVLVVPSSLAPNSVKELIALAKASPGKLNFASTAIGSAPHLAGELFKSMAGVDIVHVPYKANGPALTDLVAGRVQMLFATPASASPHIKAGRLKALAVTSAQPSALFPDLPTVAGSGVPGYAVSSDFGIFVPARTPEAIISLLNRQIARILNRADVKEKFFNIGVEVVGGPAKDFAALVKSDVAKWGKLIKDVGIRAE